ncbi:unnamed protein product, partial [Meganyctiphanes norvegica]
MYSLLSDSESQDEDDQEEEVLWDVNNSPERTRLLNGEGKAHQQQDVESKEKGFSHLAFVSFLLNLTCCNKIYYWSIRINHIFISFLNQSCVLPGRAQSVKFKVDNVSDFFARDLKNSIIKISLKWSETVFTLMLTYIWQDCLPRISVLSPFLAGCGVHVPKCRTYILLLTMGRGCICAYVGNLFVVICKPREDLQYFAAFEDHINAGSLISTFITPILRDDVKCYGDDCYALAFGVPAILMAIATALFVFGSSLYKKVSPQGNIMMEVTSCIASGIKGKLTSSKKKEHWLDHAEDKFDHKLINDVKVLLKVLLLYIPLPFFWALFDQQGSRWTFQATRMDGTIGGWTLKPDQMQVLNPFLILACIPLFDTVIYPALGRCGLLTKPLQRIFAGGALAGVAFLISAFLTFLVFEIKFQ